MLIHKLYQSALKRFPDKTAFICDDRPCTYREMDSLVDLYACTLAGLGIQKGDRVSLLMHNINEINLLYLAIWRIGAIAVPASCYNKAEEIVYVLRQSGARMLLSSHKLRQTARDAAAAVPELEYLFIADGPADQASDAWRKAVSDAPDRIGLQEIVPSDPAMIIYTSGSTDKPKGVTHTQHSLVQCAVNRCRFLEIDSRDSYINSGYLCHGAALFTAFLPMIHAGGTAIFPYSFEPAGFLDMLMRYRPTMGACGPSQLWKMLEEPAMKQLAPGFLRYFSVGGDVVPAALHQRFREAFGLPLSESIGMTECSSYLTTPPGTPHKAGSMGKPVSGVRVRLVDADGSDVRTGEPGEILVQAGTMMCGYWNDPVNTARTLVDGWLHTGDTACQDEDGYYFFVGRIKNMIVRESCNISPGAVEDVINEHPGVIRSGVVGVPDEQRGQRVIAYIVADTSRGAVPTPEELHAFVSTKLMGPRVPDQWLFVDDLPLTAVGKIDRRLLQQLPTMIAKPCVTK